MNLCKGSLQIKKILLVGIIYSFVCSTLISQSNWKESILTKNFYSGVAMSCTDINGDAIDDLLILDQSKHLWVGINNGNSHFYWSAIPFHLSSKAWSINVADIDNNNYNDILVSGEDIQLTILYQDKSGFHQTIADDSYFLSQAACVFDINQDGWLDFTLADDNEATKIYLNNGSGKLSKDTSLLNLNLSDRSKNGGNYGCIWTDFDWDGDPDLYISKCRPGVDDPNDLRRINLLYVKETNGWIEQASHHQLNLGDQSWVSVFEDFDHDGLMDVFIINHYTPCRILKQGPNHVFEDRTSQSGLDYSGIAIQVMTFDVDNDADVDMIISGTSSELWLNDGKMNFKKSSINLSDKPFTSCASGDFNNDGFLDLYVSYADLLNAPSNQKDKLWLNPGNKNNYITFNLKGKESNINGIGTKIKVYSNNHLQVRELHGGESYGIQNSLNIHVGLGASIAVDSVIVFWPSGNIDRHYNLFANHKYLMNESGCIYNFKNSSVANIFSFCNVVDTTFYADPGHKTVVWNNGSLGSRLDVNSEGVYFYTAQDDQNCFIISNPKSIILNPTLNPRLNVNYSKILCDGESIELKIGEFDKTYWSTGELSKSIRVKEAGQYYGSLQGYCTLEYSDTLDVSLFPIPVNPIIISDTLYTFRQAVLKGNKDNIKWYESQNSITPLHVGKNFETDSIFTSRYFWAEAFELHSYDEVHGGPVVPVFQSTPYHADFLNNKMLFNVYKDLILDSVTVFTDIPGERLIELFDAKGNLLNNTLVQLSAGKSQIFLGYHIPSADKELYILTTNEIKNLENLGIKSPKLYRSDKDFYYPFFIEDKLRILTSDKGDSYYYYFYDWVIREEDAVCASERIEVPVVVIPVNTTDQKLNVYLNIFSDHKSFSINSSINEPFTIEILNLEGKMISKFNEVMSHSKIDLQFLSSGVYIILIKSNNLIGSKAFKWIITN